MGTNTADLGSALSSLFTPLTAVSFLLFTLLYTPCAAAVATIKKELKSGIATLGVVLLQCAVAWIVAVAVFQIGNLFI
jgi:ferrous iron transport protein B